MDSTHLPALAAPRFAQFLLRQVLALCTQHRQLVWQLSWREVQARYRGSWLGLLWSLLNPLLMLTLYTFVFSVVFQARWSDQAPQGNLDFALAMFAGLIPFNLFAETVSASPGLVLSNPSYVKRVVFPLEVLPVARFLSGLVQASCSMLILLATVAVYRGSLPWTVAYLPLALLPLALFTLAWSWFLASLGVFIRDIGNLINLMVTTLMFMSPVFYPLSRLPESFQPVLTVNPLAPIIDSFRRVLIQGIAPDWRSWCLVTVASAGMALAGFAWFTKSKNAFADVI